MRNSKLLLKYEDELLSLNEDNYKKLEQWLDASDAYYNDEVIMSDDQFDELTEEQLWLADLAALELALQ